MKNILILMEFYCATNLIVEANREVNYSLLGCFAFYQKHFSTLCEDEPFYEVSPIDNKPWKDLDCLETCSGLQSYTYAGVVSSNRAKCLCFNNLLKLPKVNATACECRGNGMDRICPNNFKTLKAFTTCPHGYFQPPLCIDRAKASCLDHEKSGLSAAMADGRCQACVLQPGETGYERCELFKDHSYCYDFRRPGIRAAYEEPFNVKHSGDGETIEGVGISNAFLRNFHVPSFATFYLDKVKATLLAAGATFFGIWLHKDDSYMIILPGPQNVELYYKFLMNANKDYSVVEYTNVNKHVDVDLYHDKVRFGYHSIDTAQPLGDDSQAARAAHVGIAGKVYRNPEMKLDGERMDLSRNNKEFDQLGEGSWLPGKKVTVFNSVRDYEDSPPYQRFLDTQAHIVYIPLKAYFKSPCPRNCARGVCNEMFVCHHGCVSGWMGEFCMKPCPGGRYGNKCNNRCSKYCKNQSCSRFTGVCSDGCVSGRLGFYCKDRCKVGSYGPECRFPCSLHCKRDYLCSSTSGKCYGGCKVGYQPKLCVERCKNKMYGEQCGFSCGQCKGRESCDPVTGACPGGCEGNLMPPNCKCNPGSWGPACTRACGGCIGNLPCHPISGACPAPIQPTAVPFMRTPQPATEEIFTTEPTTVEVETTTELTMATTIEESQTTAELPTTSKEMTSSELEPASTNATDEPELVNTTSTTVSTAMESTVEVVTSAVSSIDNILDLAQLDPGEKCQEGLQPPTCICKMGLYGETCNNTCGKCKDGDCGFNGFCNMGCEIGYHGDKCRDICPDRFYGEDCLQECGRCHTLSCDLITGHCLDGCVPGFQPPKCKHCKAGYYGEKCENGCGSCRDNRPCLMNGWCPDDRSVDGSGICEDGWQPPQCHCPISRYGDPCDEMCGKCLLGCLQNGTCVGGCQAGFMGDQCYDPCPALKYGPNCADPCGHCLGGAPCRAVDGYCSECEPGYLLPFCNCPLGRFGPQCEHECGNCMGALCHYIDGKCLEGCEELWKGDHCNCTVGKFGEECDQDCGNCLFGADCHILNGICTTGCQDGYMMPLCNDPCEGRKWGPNCLQSCGHCVNCDKCDVTTGECPDGCEDGYIAPLCIDLCEGGTYGLNCSENCGFCFDDHWCSPVDGFCDVGCAPGYIAPLCKISCPAGTWGFGCQNLCGKCLLDPCDLETGLCPNRICIEGFKPPYCSTLLPPAEFNVSTCPPHFYIPPLCERPCGECLKQMPCNPHTGYCEAGCDPGFEPLLCQDECAVGRYGSNCVEMCGFCKGETGCRKTDGWCMEGCQDGFFGDTCKYQYQDAVTDEYDASSAENQPSCGTIILMLMLTLLDKSLGPF